MSKQSAVPYKIYRLLLLIIWFTIFQDLSCAVLFKFGMSSSLIKMVYYIKEALILICGIYSMFSLLKTFHYRILRKEIIIIIFGVLVIIYTIVGIINNGIINSAIGARQYIIPLMMLISGIYIGQSGVKNRYIIKDFYKQSIHIAQFVVLTSFVERFLLPVNFWRSINMPTFSAAIGKDSNFSLMPYDTTLTMNFYTAGIRRMVGLMTCPLMLSYFLVTFFYLMFAIILLDKNKKRKRSAFLGMVLIFAVQVFSITRAIIICELLGCVGTYIYIILRSKRVLNAKFILFLLFLGIIGLFLLRDTIFTWIYATINGQDGGSGGAHLASLLMGLNNIHDFWYGMGTGSGSGLTAIQDNTVLATEFAYSNITVDLSIMGCVIYILMVLSYVVYFSKKILRHEIDEGFRELYLTVVFSSTTWLLTGFFSPQMWAMKAVLYFWLLIGICRGTQIKPNSWKYKELSVECKGKTAI